MDVRRLGLVPYEEAWALQNRLAGGRRAGIVPDTLILLEHPHTYTIGRSGTRDHVFLSEAEMEARGITCLDVDRGGDVTYHGPGQLVGYPILDPEHELRVRELLERNCPGLSVSLSHEIAREWREYERASTAVLNAYVAPRVEGYLRNLEGCLIDVLADFEILAGRLEGYTGVWLGDRKIAAIGVKVSQGVTTHGFALNVSTDLSLFTHILACGLPDKGVTSMALELGVAPPMAAVEDAIISRFSRRFVLTGKPAAHVA